MNQLCFLFYFAGNLVNPSPEGFFVSFQLCPLGLLSVRLKFEAQLYEFGVDEGVFDALSEPR